MNLLRFVGRSLLAGFFVTNGLKAVRRPDEMVDAAEPLAEKFVPFAQRNLPPAAAAYLPTDTRSLVRLTGAAQVAGGVAIFTGIGRRAGAGLAAASMIPHVLAANPRGVPVARREAARSVFVRNLALLGAALVVSQDTQGQPGLMWRASHGFASLQRQATRTQEELARDAERLGRLAARKARAAQKSIEGALP